MKVAVVDRTNRETGKKELPEQFREEFRPDIIKRAVIAVLSHKRQPYGSYYMAGKQASAVISRRRRDYRGSYGLGISRVPRKILSRNGTRMNWTGAFAPGMVGGRRAHPPKAEKSYDVKLNRKERRKAIRSALAATMQRAIVEQRGHILPENFPFIVNSEIEDISKAKEFYLALKSLGFEKEYGRNALKKVRAGRGKSRGRRYKKNRGLLIVVSGECQLLSNCGNLPGVEVEVVDRLNAETLAPGTNPGRLAIFTDAAIERLARERLFTDSPATKSNAGASGNAGSRVKAGTQSLLAGKTTGRKTAGKMAGEKMQGKGKPLTKQKSSNAGMGKVKPDGKQ
jgi:large subunit ribosomal protein L4e